eukprot:UN02521
MGVAMTGFSAMLHIPALIGQRNWLFRERKSGMYEVLPLWIARAICQVPVNIMEALCASIPMYFMVGFHNEFSSFLKFFLLVLACIMAQTALVEFLVGLLPTEEICQAVVALYNALSVLFAGFVIQYHAMRDFLEIRILHIYR